MHSVFVIALVAAATAMPTPEKRIPPVLILSEHRVHPLEGAYNFRYESANGIVVSEKGVPGLVGQSNVQGSYSYPLADGTLASISYVADENGFRAQSPLLPVAPAFPHPIPQHSIDQIAFAEQQRKEKAKSESSL